MFGNIELPEQLPKLKLDYYLSQGWFRMGQSIFTCNILHFDRRFYSSVWLRHRLEGFQEDSNFKKLKKLNGKFSVLVKPARIDDEKENLYALYKTGISFETANSLRDLLLLASQENIFDTYEVCIYDKAKLIAVGFFDLGSRSAAGIVSFYDPEYKNHSLGKYLIYQKLVYCAAQGFDYFYPGYFAPGYPMFDYKCNIGAPFLEFFDLRQQQWRRLQQFSSDDVLLKSIEHQTHLAEEAFYFNDIKYSTRKYEYYNANYVMQFKGLDLFDYPIFSFITCSKFPDFSPILVYDPRCCQYRLLQCIGYPCNSESSDPDYYNISLLKIKHELFTTPDISEMVTFLKG